MSAKNRRRQNRRRGRRARSRKARRLKPIQIVLICLAAVLAVLVGTAVFYVASKWDKIDTNNISAEDIIINQEVRENKNVDLGEGYTNVAIFGVDSRDGSLGEGNRTDCIIVASLNNETKEIKLVSVYRDTLLDLSEGTYQKCNGAYSYGGPVLAINMLNMNLDLDIQDYVTVDFGAIADAIDLLGGVEIELTEEELPYLNQYLTETAQSAGKQSYFIGTPGLHTLDGVQATTYARIRSTAGGDFTRTERQRHVIEKMFEKAKSADLATLNEIIDKVFPQVSTSFTLSEILYYASAYSEYTLVGNMGFPQDNYTETLAELGSVVIPDDLVSNVTKLHEFLYGTTGYTPSSTVYTVNDNIAYTVSSALASSSDTEETYDETYYDDGTAYYDETYSDGTYEGDSYDDGSSGGGYYDENGNYVDSGGGGTGDGWTDTGDGTGQSGGGTTDPGTGTDTGTEW